MDADPDLHFPSPFPPPHAVPPRRAHDTMAPSPAVLAMCVSMLGFGTLNTVATKYQDRTVVGHAPDGAPIYFFAPAVQAAFMFLGEALCLGAHAVLDARPRPAADGAPSPPPRPSPLRPAVALSFARPAALDA